MGNKNDKKHNELVGKKVGKWKLLYWFREHVGKYNNSVIYYRCICDCGTERNVLKGSLFRKEESSLSCGCRIMDLPKKPSPLRKKFGEAVFNRIYSDYKKSARNKKIEFSIDKDTFKILTKKNCHYCGSTPQRKRNGIYGYYVYNGLDRVDSSGGYTKDNVVACCWPCNNMKKASHYLKFLSHISSIYNRFKIERPIPKYIIDYDDDGVIIPL